MVINIQIIITELRLLLLIIETCGVAYCTGLGNIMNRRFTSFDFIADEVSFEQIGKGRSGSVCQLNTHKK